MADVGLMSVGALRRATLCIWGSQESCVADRTLKLGMARCLQLRDRERRTKRFIGKMVSIYAQRRIQGTQRMWKIFLS